MFLTQISSKDTSLEVLMTIADNLNRLMVEKDIDTKALSLSTEISISAINAIKRGDGNPTLSTLTRIAHFLGVTLETLIGTQNEDVINDKATLIPIYHIADAEQQDKKGIIEYTTTECSQYEHHKLLGIRLHNNAMSPYFEKGSIFIICPDLNYTDGDVVLVKVEEKVFFRRIYTHGNIVHFQFIGLESSPQVYENFKIIGLVIKVIQELY